MKPSAPVQRSISSSQQPCSRQMNGPSLKCQTKGIPGFCVEDGAGEGNRLPVEKGVDDVRLNAADLVLPCREIEILHVAEGERADVVVPVGVRHPEAKELVPPLLEGQHPLRVVGQLPDQEDLQPVGRHGGIGAIAEPGKALDLVDEIALGRMKSHRLAHVAIEAIRVDAADGLAEELVSLTGMVDPLAGDETGPRGVTPGAQARPEHSLQVVGRQLRSFQPAVTGATVHGLHELQRLAVDLARSRPIVMMANSGVGEG